MDDPKALLAVVERLHAATVAPDLWSAALGATADLLGGDHAFMQVCGGKNDDAAFAASARVDECAFAYALSADGPPHPALIAPSAWPAGVATTRSALMSDRDFARTEFYNEIIRPMNGFYSCQARQDGATASFAFLICRTPRADDFGTVERVTLQRLLPYLTTAVELHHRLRVAEQRSASLSRLLDRLDAGVILTDAATRPSFVNARAAQVATEADGLTLDDAGLAGATPAATRRLREAVAAIGADAAIEGRRLRLERPSGRPPLLLTLLPVWRLGALVAGAGTPRVAIFINEPDARIEIDRLAVVDAFRLTRRESEIAAMLAGGHDLPSIAARLGLGIGTVRFHLKRTFEKTGTHSQAGLVALVRGFVEPWH